MNLSSWPGPFPTAVEQNASDKAGSFEELKHSRHLLLFRTLLHRPGPPPTSENDLSQPARGQTKSIIHCGRVLDFRSSSKRELGARAKIGFDACPLPKARKPFWKVCILSQAYGDLCSSFNASRYQILVEGKYGGMMRAI